MLNLMGATSTQRLTLMAETGVAVGVVDGLELTPKAQLAWSQNRYGGLDERGGDAALALDTLQLERVEARLGMAASGSMKVGRGWSLRPAVQVQAVQLLAGADSGMTVRFAAARDVGIALPLMSGDASWAEVKSGLSLTNGRLSLGAGVESSIGRADLRDSRAIAELGFRF
jgi:outer membrane autotransporter protein